jgi:hypothetical protein
MLARRAGAVLLAIMLGAGLAACGDDGGSEDDAVDQVDREDDSSSDDGDDGSSDDGSSDDGSSDDNDDDSSDDDSSDGDGGAFGGAFQERCVELSGLFTTVSAAISGAVDEELADAQEAFEEAVEDAPESIRDDLETYVGAYAAYAEILEDAGVDFDNLETADFTDPEVLAALQEAGAIFSDPELQEATNNISAFFAGGCEG